MENLFLYGTLRHAGLLELVAGCPVGNLACEPARLEGHRVSWAKGHGFPLIETRSAEVAEGLLLRGVEGEVLARLNFYELGFGYDLRDVTVESANGPVASKVYFPQPGLWQAGEAFSIEVWARDHWPLTRHSAAEVMSYFGRLSGEEVARRFGMIGTRANARLLAEHDNVPCELRSGLGVEDVELIASETNYAGFFLMETRHLRHSRFDGTRSDVLDREVFIAGDATTVLPYDPDRDRVMLVEQFRMGPYARGDRHPWSLEPIAGRIDGGESAEACGARETVEETGLEIQRLEPISRYYATPGYSTEMFHSFVGIADLPDDAAGLGGAIHEHEDIRSHVISFERAMALVDSGEINNAPLILSLLWLARERERLRQR
ncbi:NUDIX domain-containing protein [Alisedimentitalea sp. MJ-SS2]|uniref:NUDIX domain-containing protein n=1 Tax=Aliisedimentitalea sp. MJ-SS2 TaxID=3049795 RepID=UPI00290E041D|nr:NUDIX domain-containing protein [Alisedimentitalea sp. MJ-SS2]MDU8929210.1 NUDIX domain-containing protein [Alisedimentitalea sp. MJ-SS2]